MQMFSIIAGILVPPTLISGIYGMNFEHMPELKWLWGYPFGLGLILTLVTPTRIELVFSP